MHHLFRIEIRILILFTIVGLFSCNRDIEIPSYIQIDSYEFKAKNEQGTDRQEIDFVWVYLNAELRGAFPLGTPIPLLAEGEQRVRIFAGFYDNDNKAFPEINLLWKAHTVSEPLVRDEIIHVDLAFSYVDNIEFAFIEDFERGNTFLKDLDDFDTKMTTTNVESEVYEGNESGVLEVNADKNSNAVTHPDVITEFGLIGGEVILEIDYKTETDFSIGIMGLLPDGSQNYFPILRDDNREQWTKVYVDIGTTIRDYNIQAFSVVLIAYFNEDYGGEKQKVFVDNLKLIHVE